LTIADDIGWARLPVPGSLKHINMWILDDGEGVAIVDTGFDIPACREGWEALLAGPLSGAGSPASSSPIFIRTISASPAGWPSGSTRRCG
jgi:hypothetical protein